MTNISMKVSINTCHGLFSVTSFCGVLHLLPGVCWGGFPLCPAQIFGGVSEVARINLRKGGDGQGTVRARGVGEGGAEGVRVSSHLTKYLFSLQTRAKHFHRGARLEMRKPVENGERDDIVVDAPPPPLSHISVLGFEPLPRHVRAFAV